MTLGRQTKNLLYRKRIFNHLQKCTEYPLTILVAGAGYGKTVAVSSFLQQSSAKTLWYQLTLMDTNTTRFWGKFTLRLSEFNQEFSDKVSALEFPDTVGKSNFFYQMLVENMNPETNYIIVFDDFHLIQDSSLKIFVDSLVNACLPMLSVIIISRTYPPINTITLMSKNMLLEINEDHLRFTEGEMLEYFYKQGLVPSDTIVSRIYKHTKGWILAIYLTSLSLQLKPSSGEFALKSMKLNIFKLIEREIYEPLSDVIKQFLVMLSLFDAIPSELLMELAENNNELISSITQITSFIRYDIYENTYNFHHLFLDFLHEKQVLLTDEQKKAAYVTAAKWYLNNQYKIDAITCYKHAKEYKSMLLVITTFPTMISSTLIQYILNLLDGITDMKEERYLASIMYARYSALIKTRAEMNVMFAHFKEMFDQLPPSPNKSYLICALNSIIGTYNMLAMGENFYEYFKISYETGKKALVTTVYSVGDYALPLLQTSSFGKFMNEVDLTMPYMTHVLNGCGSGYNDLCKGEYAFFQRNWGAATKHLLQAKTNAKKENQYYIEDLALFYLLRIKIAEGNYDETMCIIEQLKQQTGIYPYADYFTKYSVASGWFYVQIGHTDKSAVWNSKDVIEPKDMTSTYASGCFQLLIARCYLSEKQFDECIALLSSIEKERLVEKFFFGKLEVMLLKAVTLYHLDEKEQAIKMLQTAYDLSYSNNFIMPFVELGNHMLALIKMTMKYNENVKNTHIPEEWLVNIKRKASAYAKKVSYLAGEYNKKNALENDIIQKLSKRELECLQDLCKGLSRADIAADKNLFENYVKLIIQNIYTKLRVKNSKQAIRVATMYNLV